MTTTDPWAMDFDDRPGFAAAVRAAVGVADARGARSMTWVDPDFVAWPLDAPGLIEATGAWLRRPGRRLVLLAQRFDRLDREHPKFAAWRIDWLHAIDALAPVEVRPESFPTILVDDGPTCLSLHDPLRLRGRAASDAHAAVIARETIDALAQRSGPSWPARRLGL